MKIGIVTIYESITNFGSFLQAYALKQYLEKEGHEVYFVQNISTMKSILKNTIKINPKREFFSRFKKAFYFVKDIRKLTLVDKKNISKSKFDCLIYGSDEIWNLDNPYFQDGLFWGKGINNIPQIAYAVSMGEMKESSFFRSDFLNDVKKFSKIMVRDNRTFQILKKTGIGDLSIVCDPTLLVPLEKLSKQSKIPNYKYLLVYSYGIDEHLANIIKLFAKNNNLKIVSVCFWHYWVDKIIECESLQFSDLIQGAEYVFTSTFHGAVFTMLNHKKCCILPVRVKVEDVVRRLGMENHLITDKCDYNTFSNTMYIEFDVNRFENKLKEIRENSCSQLKEVLECLEK